MILPLLAAAAMQSSMPIPEADRERFAQCAALARSDPQSAIDNANGWRAAGGGISARHCLALAYSELELWPAAATAWEQAARDADAASDPRRSYFWHEAGLGWAASGEPTRAVEAYDAALAGRSLAAPARASLLLDRAAALVDLGSLAGARAAIDEALALAASDPRAHHFSAGLARRQNDLARARRDIARAMELAPADPDIVLLAGTIAGLAGDGAEAERLYRRAIALDPEGEAGAAARASLESATETEVDPQSR